MRYKQARNGVILFALEGTDVWEASPGTTIDS
jgi:hypothetical protein